jgi:outer membrane protein OmpA-like peptidoglycan-associated protein
LNKFIKTIGLIVAFVLIISVCGGCNSKLPQETPTAMILIIGNHANSKDCTFSLENDIADIYSNFGVVNVVSVDGNPSIAEYPAEKDKTGKVINKHNPIGYLDKTDLEESKRAYQTNNDLWKTRYLNPLVKQVIDAIDKVSADDPEVDVLKALTVAEKQLNQIEKEYGGNINKKIVICDTGLSTSGSLNFINEEENSLLGMQKQLKADEDGKSLVKNLVNNLNVNSDIPNLKDVAVTWYGLGAVGGEQEELSNLAIKNLQYIWGEILCKSNVTPNENKGENGTDEDFGFFIDINSREDIVNDNPVTKVVFWSNVGEPLEGGDGSSDPPLIAPNSLFEKDKATFKKGIDPEKQLKQWADNIKLYPEKKFLLVGTTADPKKTGGDKDLSLKRANAVKAVLMKMGIDDNRLEVKGLGSLAPWYDENEWQDGKFLNDSEAANSNRAVRILPINSTLAQKIMQGNYD